MFVPRVAQKKRKAVSDDDDSEARGRRSMISEPTQSAQAIDAAELIRWSNPVRRAGVNVAVKPKTQEVISKEYEPESILADQEAFELVEPEKKSGAHAQDAKRSKIFSAPSKATIKMTTRFDYQADVCKDYKETGYCGFGDSCKFLHDRSDFKSGWEIDEEWKAAQRKQSGVAEARPEPRDKPSKTDEAWKKFKRSSHTETSTVLPQIPERCADCRNLWGESVAVRPVCGHVFCEDCFLSNSVERCQVCRKPTFGTFEVVPNQEPHEADQTDSSN